MKLFVLWAALAGAALLQVNDKNFKEVVIDSGKFTLVDFYADWCRHCKNLMPTIEQLAETFAANPEIQVAKLNGDSDGRKTTKKYDIPGFPMLMLFHGDDEPLEFEGRRDHDSISNFVRSAAGINSQSDYNLAEDLEYTPVVSFYTDDNFQHEVLRANHQTAVLFTESRENCRKVNSIWNNLANTVYAQDRATVRFGVVSLDDSNKVNVARLAGQFGVTLTPQILFFDPGKVHADGLRRPSMYHGDLTSESLISFINGQTNLGRAADGKLSDIAGRISLLDEAISSITENTKQTVLDTIQELEDSLSSLGRDALIESKQLLLEDDVSMLSYYRKLAEKSEVKDFARKEASRLERILTNHAKDLEQNAHQNMHKRLNILQKLIE